MLLQGVTQNETAAHHLFLRAAEAGHPPSQSSAAFCFEFGIGTSKDLHKAMYWYSKAAPHIRGVDEHLKQMDAPCMVCGAGGIYMCGGCCGVRYCSSRCQKGHYKVHRATCKEVRCPMPP